VGGDGLGQHGNRLHGLGCVLGFSDGQEDPLEHRIDLQNAWPTRQVAPDLLASAVALGGALFWGCGSVYAKRAPHPGQPLLASGMEMICAGVALCLIGAASGEFGRISAASLLSTSGLALGYLIVFGSLLGYSTYEWLLHHASSQVAGTYAFVCPLVAVVLGWWLLGEQISGHTLLAAAAIAVGVALIMLHSRKPQPVRDETGDQFRKPPAGTRL
jgi:drug/metabolite transporter (DMT)-like permease